MRGVGRAIATVAREHPDMLVVLPVHRNPVVQEALLPPLRSLPNVLVTEPLGYGDFSRLMVRATLILTDSGGVQEEAPSLGKPVLVLRDNTERPEAVRAGTVRLVGTDPETVVRRIEELLINADAYAVMARAVNPYGDGTAASRSLEAVRNMLGSAPLPEDFHPTEAVPSAARASVLTG